MSIPLPSPETLLPHAPPMRMLERVAACDATALEGEATLRPDHPLANDGKVPAVAALELMAQAAAAWVGWHGRARDEAPRPGFLVNVRELTVELDAFDVGTDLRVRVRAGDGDEGLRQFEGTVWMTGHETTAAHARFAVYRPAPAARHGDTA